MARFSNLWDEAEHPRDRLGRFRNKWKIGGKAKAIVDAILDRFNPKTFPDFQRANQYAVQRGWSRYTPDQKKSITSYIKGDFKAIDAELQKGVESPESKSIDSAMHPLEDDLIISRSFSPERFGLAANDAQAAEELTGKLIASKTYQNGWMGPATNNGGIQLHILAPRGTPAVFSGGAEVMLSRNQPIRITRAERVPDGSLRLYGVAVPHGTAGNLRPSHDVPGAVQAGRVAGNAEPGVPQENIPGKISAPSAPTPERMTPNPRAGEIAPAPAPARHLGDTPGGVEKDGRPSWTYGNAPIELAPATSTPGGGGITAKAGNQVLIQDAPDLETLATEADRAGLPEVANWARANHRFVKGSDAPAAGQRAAQRALLARQESNAPVAPQEPNASGAPQPNAPAAPAENVPTPSPNPPQTPPAPAAPAAPPPAPPAAAPPANAPGTPSQPGTSSPPQPAAVPPGPSAAPEPQQLPTPVEPAPAPPPTPSSSPQVPVDLNQPLSPNATPEQRAARAEAVQNAAEDAARQNPPAPPVAAPAKAARAARVKKALAPAKAAPAPVAAPPAPVATEPPSTMPEKKAIKKAVKAPAKMGNISAEEAPAKKAVKSAAKKVAPKKAVLSPEERKARLQLAVEDRKTYDDARAEGLSHSAAIERATGPRVAKKAAVKKVATKAAKAAVSEKKAAPAAPEKAVKKAATPTKRVAKPKLTPAQEAQQNAEHDVANAEQRKVWSAAIPGGEPKDLRELEKTQLDQTAEFIRTKKWSKKRAVEELRGFARNRSDTHAAYLNKVADFIETSPRAPRKAAVKKVPETPSADSLRGISNSEERLKALDGLGVAELRKIATEAAVPGRSKLTKEALKKAISDHLGASKPTAPAKAVAKKAAKVAKKAAPEVSAPAATEAPVKAAVKAAPTRAATRAARPPAKAQSPEVQARQAEISRLGNERMAATQAADRAAEKTVQDGWKEAIGAPPADLSSIDKSGLATVAGRLASKKMSRPAAARLLRSMATKEKGSSTNDYLNKLADHLETRQPRKVAAKAVKKVAAPEANPVTPAEQTVKQVAAKKLTPAKAAAELRARAQAAEDASALQSPIANKESPRAKALTQRAAELRQEADSLAAKKVTKKAAKAATTSVPVQTAKKVPGFDELAGMKSREEVHQRLDALTVAELKQVAKDGGVTHSASVLKPRLKQLIADKAVGNRLNTDAIMGASEADREAARVAAVTKARARKAAQTAEAVATPEPAKAAAVAKKVAKVAPAKAVVKAAPVKAATKAAPVKAATKATPVKAATKTATPAVTTADSKKFTEARARVKQAQEEVQRIEAKQERIDPETRDADVVANELDVAREERDAAEEDLRGLREQATAKIKKVTAKAAKAAAEEKSASGVRLLSQGGFREPPALAKEVLPPPVKKAAVKKAVKAAEVVAPPALAPAVEPVKKATKAAKAVKATASTEPKHTREELLDMSPGQLKDIEDNLGIERPSLVRTERADAILKAQAGEPAPKKTAAQRLAAFKAADVAKKAAAPAAPAPAKKAAKGAESNAIQAGKFSDKPVPKNHWGAGGGEINYHPDGVIGVGIRSMGEDRKLEVDGLPLETVLGHIATDTVSGKTTTNQMLEKLRALRNRLPESGKAKSAVTHMIAQINAPAAGSVHIPAETPAPIKELYSALSDIPLARKVRPNDNSSGELGRLFRIIDDFNGGRLGGLRLIREIEGLQNGRHESVEGKFELDRAVKKAVDELKGIYGNAGTRSQLRMPEKKS